MLTNFQRFLLCTALLTGSYINDYLNKNEQISTTKKKLQKKRNPIYIFTKEKINFKIFDVQELVHINLSQTRSGDRLVVQKKF